MEQIASSLIEFSQKIVQNKSFPWIFGCVSLLIVVGIVYIRVWLQNQKLRKIQDLYQNGHYAEMMELAIKLKRSFFSMPSMPYARGSVIYNNLSLLIASAALRTGDEELFQKHIKDVYIEEQKYFVEMWLVVYHLCKKNIDSAKEHYEQFLQTKETDRKPVVKTFLDALLSYTEGNYELAGNLLAIIEKNVENPVMRDFSDDLIHKRMK